MTAPVILYQITLMPFVGFIDVLRHSANEDDRSRQSTRCWTIADGSHFARQLKAMFGVTPRAARGLAGVGAG